MSFREKVQKFCDSFEDCGKCPIYDSCKKAHHANLPHNMTDKELKIIRTAIVELSKKLADMAVEE